MELGLFLQARRNRWAKQIHIPAKQRRVRGFPIRDCAESFYILEPMCPKLSPIDVTEKTLFERFYLVIGLVQICSMNQLSVCCHPPTVFMPAISRFLFNFIWQVAPRQLTAPARPFLVLQSLFPWWKVCGDNPATARPWETSAPGWHQHTPTRQSW